MSAVKTCTVGECKKPFLARGMCAKHYYRWRKNGDPNTLVIPTERGAPIVFIQKARLETGTECVRWPFRLDSKGYGRIKIEGRTFGAHNFMCRITRGDPPTPEHEVAHSCGNRACVNPNHLRWATRKENAADTLIHGTRARGSQIGKRKLRERDIPAIRAALQEGTTQGAVARAYGVSTFAIYSIAKGRTWAWVPDHSDVAVRGLVAARGLPLTGGPDA